MAPKETELKTARLLLTPLRPQDAPALYKATSDPEVMRYWDWPEHDSILTTTAFIATELEEVAAGKAFYWAIRTSRDAEALGTCDLSEIDDHHKRAEVGFLFAQAAWGKGYAHEAMQAVITHAKSELGIERLTARTHAGNEKSARLLKRLTFEFEGTLKAYIRRDGIRKDCWLFGRDSSFSPME
jgi:[ribosomal protein S5]-alanine N-acetyltransferase